MGFGTFDTLNPYTLKGTSPYNSPGLYIYGFGELTDSLLGGSGTHQNPGDEKAVSLRPHCVAHALS